MGGEFAGGRASGAAPAGKRIAGAGQTARGQILLLVIFYALDGCDLALGVGSVLIEFDRVGDGLPLGGEGRIGGDDGVCRQLFLAVVPAVEFVAGLTQVGGDIECTDGRVLRDLKRADLCVAVRERDRKGIRPQGVEVPVRGRFDLRAVGIGDVRAVRGRCPTGKHLARAGKGVRLQRALAVVDLLVVVLALTASGVEGHNSRRTRREAAHIDAVVIFVAAAVLFVDDRQDITAFCFDLQRRPVDHAAHAVYQRFAAELDRELVAFLLRRDLILKRHRRIARKGELQGAAG